MSQIGKNHIKKSAFSLIEIIVSLAIFSFIMTAVVTISLQMANTQKRIQAKLFLAQTAQTLIESMSRQLRYGYSYSGTIVQNGNEIVVTSNAVKNTDLTGDCANYTTGGCLETNYFTQTLTDAKNSPYIIFESQNGNPDTLADQFAFCVKEKKLYKISTFTQESPPSGTTFGASCDTGNLMIPESIEVEEISFDIYSGNAIINGDTRSGSEAPKNPTVRIKMKLKHEVGGIMEIQTSVTQRLITYF